MNRFEIAKNIATGTLGWLPAYRVGNDAISVQSINALAVGVGAAFDIELWITSVESIALAPIGFVKLLPNLAGASTAEFATEASNFYLFDAPFLWIRPRVISLTGTLTIWGVAR